jgi:hypothetical protein
MAGALFRTAIAIHGVPACSSSVGEPAFDPSPRVVVDIEKAVTWPPTGIGMALAQARHGHRCLMVDESLYYDEHRNGIIGRRSFTVGDVYLSHLRAKQSEASKLALFDHERHHRRQWAVGTLLGGPLAFPVAYTVDDIFFPRAQNHFEREAGLARGGYDPDAQTGPKLRVQDIAVLAVIAGSVELVAHLFRRRRSIASGRTQDVPHGPASG